MTGENKELPAFLKRQFTEDNEMKLKVGALYSDNDNIDDYLSDYTFEADEGSYTPNANERMVIADAIHGYIEWLKDLV